MKQLIKYIIICTCILFYAQNANSQQNTNKGSINIGFEAGMQISGISDPYMLISNTGIGYAAGGYVEYHITDLINLRGGLYLDNRAFSLEDMGAVVDSNYVGKSSYYDITQKFKVDYLTIPLSIIYIKGSDKFKFFIQGTFYYSIFINSNQTGDLHVHISDEDAPNFDFPQYPELSIPGDYYLPVKDDVFSSSDMGINFFVGGIYYINPRLGITLSPGFTYSFENVWEDPLRTTTWARLYKVNLGISYKIK